MIPPKRALKLRISYPLIFFTVMSFFESVVKGNVAIPLSKARGFRGRFFLVEEAGVWSVGFAFRMEGGQVFFASAT